RTGSVGGIDDAGVEPYLGSPTKAIASVLPLSSVVGRAEIMDAPGVSAIGGTYVGNPVAQVAALAELDVFEEEDLSARAVTIGETIRTRMLAWQIGRAHV